MNMKDDDCVSAVALVVDEDSNDEPDGQEQLASRGWWKAPRLPSTAKSSE